MVDLLDRYHKCCWSLHYDDGLGTLVDNTLSWVEHGYFVTPDVPTVCYQPLSSEKATTAAQFQDVIKA